MRAHKKFIRRSDVTPAKCELLGSYALQNSVRRVRREYRIFRWKINIAKWKPIGNERRIGTRLGRRLRRMTRMRERGKVQREKGTRNSRFRISA